MAGISVFAVSQKFAFPFSTWTSIVSESGHHRTLGGWWYLIVANSLAQFLLWRWVWRAVIVLVIFLAPLLLFTPLLVEAKDKGLREYGTLAVSHSHMFHRKWVHGENPAADPMLGTPEISSLADLGAAYGMLAEMRWTAFDPGDAVVLLLAALIPMAPLLLTIMPLDKLLELLPNVSRSRVR